MRGWTPAAWPWCRELVSPILSGWIRFAEIGCINSPAGPAANGRGSGSLGLVGAVPRTSLLWPPTATLTPCLGLWSVGPQGPQASCRRTVAESPCAPGRPLHLRGCPWTSASEMQSARPRPVLLNQCRRLTRVQVALVLWRVEQRHDNRDRPTTAAGLQNALDLALVRFRMYSTEVSGGHTWKYLI